jgi:hypothetical protein
MLCVYSIPLTLISCSSSWLRVLAHVEVGNRPDLRPFLNQAPHLFWIRAFVILEVRLVGSGLGASRWARVLELALARVCEILQLVNVSQLG